MFYAPLMVLLLPLGTIHLVACDDPAEPPAPEEARGMATTPPTPTLSISEACREASPLSSGTLEMTAGAGSAPFPGSCSTGTGGASVFRLEIAAPSRLQVDTLEAGPSLLWVSDGCGHDATEIACDGFEFDAPLNVDRVVAAGVYFIAVAPVPELPPTAVTLEISVDAITEMRARCAASPALELGEAHAGTTRGAVDRYVTPCHEIDTGPESMHRLSLEEDTVVEITARLAGGAALWVVDSCPVGPLGRDILCAYYPFEGADDAEDATAAEREAARRALQDHLWRLPLEAGEHFVVLDTFGRDGADYTLTAALAE